MISYKLIISDCLFGSCKAKEIISLKKEAVYGNSKKVLFRRMGDMAVDKLGRAFIANVQEQFIHVFEFESCFIGQLVREGKGPREFIYINLLFH